MKSPPEMADFYFGDIRDRSPNSEVKVEKNSRAVEYYVVQDDKLVNDQDSADSRRKVIKNKVDRSG